MVGRITRLLLAVVALLALAVPSFASGWTAPDIDYTTSAQGVVTSIGTMISTVLPIAVLLLGITLGVRYFMKFLSRAAK
jgi:hypothetical protein